MSLRLPQTLSSSIRRDSGMTALEAELAGERGDTLGRLGREVERTLAILKDAPADEARPAVLKAAADAVWKYLVQREACGARRHDEAISTYGIPREVLMRLGINP